MHMPRPTALLQYNRSSRVGTVVCQCRPDVFSVVVDAANVVLDVTWRGQCCVGNAFPVSIVDEQMGITGTKRTVCSIDNDILAIRNRGLRPVAQGR